MLTENQKQIRKQKLQEKKDAKKKFAKNAISEKDQKIADLQKRLNEIELNGINISKKGEKNSIYSYPESHMNKEWINSESGKKYRDGLRRKIQSFANNMFYYKQCNDMEKLNLEISNFDKHYATYYSVNDYSLNSISNAKNEGKLRNVELMLKIIKIVKGM